MLRRQMMPSAGVLWPFGWENLLCVEDYSRRLWVISKVCELVRELLQDSCSGDDVLLDDGADDGNRLDCDYK